VREVHYGDGITARLLKVYCRRRQACVPVQDCSTCELCTGFLLDPSGRHSFLTCTYGPLADAAEAEAAEVPTEPALIAERTPVAQVMTKDVVCVTEDMDVDELMRLFLERGISGVPVVDPSGKPLGVVSKTDIVRSTYEHADTQEVEQRVQARDAEGYEYELEPGFHQEHASRGKVGEIMTPVTYSLRPSTSVAQAAALMAFEGVHRLPIVTEVTGEVVGVLSSIDILRWLGESNGYLMRRPDGVAAMDF
jgi:CBS domain-containing protein